MFWRVRLCDQNFGPSLYLRRKSVFFLKIWKGRKKALQITTANTMLRSLRGNKMVLHGAIKVLVWSAWIILRVDIYVTSRGYHIVKAFFWGLGPRSPNGASRQGYRPRIYSPCRLLPCLHLWNALNLLLSKQFKVHHILRIFIFLKMKKQKKKNTCIEYYREIESRVLEYRNDPVSGLTPAWNFRSTVYMRAGAFGWQVFNRYLVGLRLHFVIRSKLITKWR